MGGTVVQNQSQGVDPTPTGQKFLLPRDVLREPRVIEGRARICNYPSRLPATFWRPGQVDYRYPFLLPEVLERELVARAICRKYSFAEDDLDFAALAAATAGYTGAQIERVFLDARNLAVREGHDRPTHGDVEAALADCLYVDDATAAILAQRIDLGHPELNTMTL